MWVLFSVLTALAWGASETIFKRSSEGDERSVVRLLAYNGVVYGVSGVIYMIINYVVTGVSFEVSSIAKYAPIAATYILSMFFYYNAMSRAKISIVSPIVNTSCIVTAALGVIILRQRPSVVQIAAIAAIIVSIVVLSLAEGRAADKEQGLTGNSKAMFITGLIFAFGYFVFDGVASFMDDYTLDEALSEFDVIVAYALIYLAVGIFCLIYLKITDKDYRFSFDRLKFIGTLFETSGQYTFVFALGSGMSSVVSPFIASYSAVTIVLSRIFLKEKLKKEQYICVAVIVAGLVALSAE
ncbi:MAG: DMT family transporter [Clostridiales bacterium]|jgi:drug/metabolite transporter (DMT)-like permease|nr:DMT family transporter [Clostridiales bacterium]